jgi:hypothetical protein
MYGRCERAQILLDIEDFYHVLELGTWGMMSLLPKDVDKAYLHILRPQVTVRGPWVCHNWGVTWCCSGRSRHSTRLLTCIAPGQLVWCTTRSRAETPPRPPHLPSLLAELRYGR